MKVIIDDEVFFRVVINPKIFLEEFKNRLEVLESFKRSVLTMQNNSNSVPKDYFLALISYQYDWGGFIENLKIKKLDKLVTFVVKKALFVDLYTYQNQTLDVATGELVFETIKNSGISRYVVSNDFYAEQSTNPQYLVMDVVNCLQHTITNIIDKVNVKL